MKALVKRASPALLVKAKQLFGELVTEAYLTHYHYSNMLVSDTHLGLARAEDFYANQAAAKDLNYEADKILLTFVNGTSLLFTNSEWAYIEKVNLSEIPNT